MARPREQRSWTDHADAARRTAEDHGQPGAAWRRVRRRPLPPDVHVESETFNRRYRVRSANPKFASDLLQPRTIEALLSVEPFDWRIEGRDLIAWGPPTDDMASVLSRLDVLATIVRNIPEFVWKDVGQAADPASSYW